MPWADYECPECGAVKTNVVFSADRGAAASAPYCTEPMDEADLCGVRMEVIPQVGLMSAANGSTFKAFDVTREVLERNPETGQVERFHRRERIDSLAKLRAVERDSEQRAKNGEGEPMRFRAFSQNRTNMDVGSFGPMTPETAVLKRSGRVRVKAVTPTDAPEGGEPTVETGPGMAGSQALAGDQ